MSIVADGHQNRHNRHRPDDPQQRNSLPGTCLEEITRHPYSGHDELRFPSGLKSSGRTTCVVRRFLQSGNSVLVMRSTDPLHLTSSSRLLVVGSDPATDPELIRCPRETPGLQVDVVTGVSEACRRLMDRPYDGVLLDDGLPEPKEGPCLALIRDMFSAADLPVILRIRQSSAAVTRTALLQGANDVVTCQESPDVVLARLTTHLQLQQTRQALREGEERYALAARGSNDGLWDWNLDSGEVYFSPRWKAMLGCQAVALDGRPEEWFERVHPEDRLRFREMFSDQQTAAATHLEREVRMLHQDGGYRWMLCRGVCVRNAEGRVYRMAGSLTDITEGKVGDPLTGLPNRLLFVDRLERTIERTR